MKWVKFCAEFHELRYLLPPTNIFFPRPNNIIFTFTFLPIDILHRPNYF